MIILYLLLISILAGTLYRFGGWGLEGFIKFPKLPYWLFNTKARDFGIPLCMLLYMLVVGAWHDSLWICFFLVFGAQTTYFKKKGTSVKWWNWMLVGLAFGVSMLPYAIATGCMIGFYRRTFLLILLTVAICEASENDFIEEFSRGFIQIYSLGLLTT